MYRSVGEFRLLVLALVCAIGLSTNCHAQKYKSFKSQVHFYSKAPVEDIEAENSGSQSILDAESGHIVFAIPIDQFQFDKSLMQEHFNENYMETDEFPTATFRADLTSWSGLQSYESIIAKGELNVHGVKKEREIEGAIAVSDDVVSVDAEFWIELKDHDVKIPKAVFYNIAEKIKVTVHFEYQPI